LIVGRDFVIMRLLFLFHTLEVTPDLLLSSGGKRSSAQQNQLK